MTEPSPDYSPLHIQPITPRQDGKPPGFIVLCRDCGYAHDVHADTPEAAVAAISERHAGGQHRLVAAPTRYHEPIWGKDHNIRHPMYYPEG
jgi:hypothetical protein